MVHAETDSSGTNTMLADGSNSTLGLVNSSGSLATQFAYEPFGRTTFSGSGTSNLYRFTGRELDTTGLYFMRARYYNPILQRFLSPDPSGFAGGDPNIYAYVGNNPTNSTDPLGLGSSGWGCENCSTGDLLKHLSAVQDPFLSSVPGSLWSVYVPGTGQTFEELADSLPFGGSSLGFPGLTSIGGFSVSPGVAPSGVGTAGLVPRGISLAQGGHQAPGIVPVGSFAAAPAAGAAGAGSWAGPVAMALGLAGACYSSPACRTEARCAGGLAADAGKCVGNGLLPGANPDLLGKCFRRGWLNYRSCRKGWDRPYDPVYPLK
jgi:RHS repeat-associated protein